MEQTTAQISRGLPALRNYNFSNLIIYLPMECEASQHN